MPDLPSTAPEGKKEVGEIYVSPVTIELAGFIYMFYKHRGGLHYEGYGRYPSGIYSSRMQKVDFDSLFES